MQLSDLSVRRPVFAAVVAVLLCIVGVVGYLSLSVREYPDTDPPVVSVETVYTGEQEDGQGMRWTFPHFDDGNTLTPAPGEPGDRFHILEEGWMHGGAQWCGSQCASWTDWTCAGFLYKYWGTHNEGDPEKEIP